MSKDNITLVIGAKDMASGVINRVRATTVALGVATGQIFARGIVAAMNAARGLVNGILEAERANVMLDAALRGSGQYTPQLARQYRDLATAIQDETAASDEATKASIAQLITLGVSPDKMAVATRATQALAAIGRDSSLAMIAVARAVEGDITAFERFAPEVSNATTLAEKYAAANKLLNAGYAQQRANLQTVGGAWEALKGRMGDAIEDMGNAITQGLRLGATLNDAQAAVGRFLQSEAWKSFTDRLAAGAGYVADIAKAMTVSGGGAEIAKSFGNVILGALKDGAAHLGNQIRGALGAGKVAAAGKYWGGATSGMSSKDFATGGLLGSIPFVGPLLAAKFLRGNFSHDMGTAALNGADADGGDGGHLTAALKQFDDTVKNITEKYKRMSEESNKIAINIGQFADDTEQQRQPTIDITAALEKQEQAHYEAAWAEDRIAGLKRDQETAEKALALAVDRERVSAEAAATAAEDREKVAKMGNSEWLKGLSHSRSIADTENAENLDIFRRRTRIMKKLGANPGDNINLAIEDAARRGKHLSKGDDQFLRDLQAKGREESRLTALSKNEAARALSDKREIESRRRAVEDIQKRMLTELEGIRTDLRGSMVVQ